MNPLAYGHEFHSFCLVARPAAPVSSVESLAFALQKALCDELEIESMDIGVSWRWLAKRTAEAGAEIILYDRAPGGAGFAKEGYNSWQAIVNRANEVCAKCRCDRACYDCLKTFGNQPYHEKLNRAVVSKFLSTA